MTSHGGGQIQRCLSRRNLERLKVKAWFWTESDQQRRCYTVPRQAALEYESSDFGRKLADIGDVFQHLEKVSKSCGLWWTLLALLGCVEDEVNMRSTGSRRG
jgi:hypothetical protein